MLIVVATLSFGGAERTAANVSRVLAKQHDVTVLAFHGNVTYPYSGALIDLGMPYAPDVGFLHKLRRLHDKFVGYRKAYRQVQPDVVFSFTEGPNIIALLNRQFGLRSRIITNTQIPLSQLYRGTYKPIYRLLIRSLYRKADCVVALSPGIRDELIQEFGVPKEKTRVIYNPVDITQVKLRSVEPVSDPWPVDGVPVILTVGRLAPQKNHALLIRAFAELSQQIEARLVIIGSGPLEGDLRRLIAERQLDGRAVLLGWQDNPFKYMSRAAAFVLSSNFEGFGNVLVEAMASGCPVVSTDCPFGPSDILQNGDYGMLAPVEDQHALAQAIQTLLTDDQLRGSLSQAGRKRAEMFSLDRIGQEYLHLLESIGQSRPM